MLKPVRLTAWQPAIARSSGRPSTYIYTLFGQVPDILEDVWIDVALGESERAKKVIASVPTKHPFELRYQTITKVDRLKWQ